MATCMEQKNTKKRKKGSGTEYCLAIIPFGGYVKVAGMVDESMDSSFSHKPFELMSKPQMAANLVYERWRFNEHLSSVFNLHWFSIKQWGGTSF